MLAGQRSQEEEQEERGRQKGGREKEKRGEVWPKKPREAREKPSGSSLRQMVASIDPMETCLDEGNALLSSRDMRN